MLDATRQVGATSFSEQGVANRQNGWERFSKRLKLSQNPTKLEEARLQRSQQPKYMSKHINDKKHWKCEKKEGQLKGTQEQSKKWPEVVYSGDDQGQCPVGIWSWTSPQDQTFRVSHGNQRVGLTGLVLAGGQIGWGLESCCRPPEASRHSGRSSPWHRRMQLHAFYHRSQIVPLRGAGKLRSPASQ